MSVVCLRKIVAAALVLPWFLVDLAKSDDKEAPPLVGSVEEFTAWQAATPAGKVQADWILQDAGPDVSRCFTSDHDSQIEMRMVVHVIDELGRTSESFRRRMQELLENKLPGRNSAWKALYFDACQARRQARLAPLIRNYSKIVYTKHYCIGGSHYAYTENPTDAQRSERNHSNSDWRMGAELCLLKVHADGRVVSRTLLEEPDGVIRDPDVSYDGCRIIFSRRDSAYEDDFHVYELDIATGSVRQLTFGLGFADIEPAYLPNGDIVFPSTRCMQITDCFWTEVANLYLCDKDGNFLRRIGFDQVTTNYPKVLEDGRVTYTRWDYNDRGQVYPQPLFVMNPDGTGQTEFYGNNSWFPTTLLHARGIPGTHKLIAVASGHHCHQRGKLIVVDPMRGHQEASGVQLIAPVRKTPPERIDAYGQQGDQFQYPYPIDATHFLVTYDPIGSKNKKYDQSYGIYFMDVAGRRELLAWDAEISCNQPVPLAARPVPSVRASQVDYTKPEGTYYIQDIYAGEALAGVPRGKIKKVRVVGLQYRAAGIRSNNSHGPAGGALSSTPVSIGNGCWDVKVILGHATVYDDGSAWFIVPARTPAYFQALDAENRAVQTMRSWSTLQPGENRSCVGCHEKKNDAPLTTAVTIASSRGPQRLKPWTTGSRGFSYEKDIQPIFDHYCVACHFDRSMTIDWENPLESTASLSRRAFSLLGDTTEDAHAGRCWADSYLALTAANQSASKRAWQGLPNRLVSWVTSQSGPSMLPPYSAGSTQSEFYTLLRQRHGNVELSRTDLDKIACWIDLGVPYCGDYIEANCWTKQEQAVYAYYQAKRHRMREIENLHLAAYLAARQGDQRAGERLPTFDAGGPDRKQAFLQQRLTEQFPIVGLRRDTDNTYRNLALNPRDTQGIVTCYPHATSNSEYNSKPAFAARNAIDGKTANRGHGPTFPSWGPHKRTDLWWKLEFGRPVEIDKVVLYIRADFPHDDYWQSATIAFSDGSEEHIAIAKTAAPQTFAFAKRTVTWLKLTDLVEEMPLGWCGLTEVEAWGRDLKE